MNVDAVSDIFSRVLEVPDVGAESDFFDLGGDSLLATRVLSRIAHASGVELTFEDFLAAPTPATLATMVGTVRVERR